MMYIAAAAAILVALAAPNMSVFFRNSARTTMLNDLVAAVQYGRSQAVTLNQQVTICPVDLVNDASFSATNAAGKCRTDADFTEGWVVFVDVDDPVGQIGNTNDQVLRVFKPSDVGGGTEENQCLRRIDGFDS